jgi:hypothetical protein
LRYEPCRKAALLEKVVGRLSRALWTQRGLNKKRCDFCAEKSEATKFNDQKAQPAARANGAVCHDLCLRTARASQHRGSSVTFGKK